MGDRYYLTGVQLRILMSNTDEKIRMDLLNKIMNDQYLGEKGDFVNLFEELNDNKDSLGVEN